MKLIIAEKPSVARNLADSLEKGNYSKADGYLQGKKYTYSWAIGHLVTLADAKNYCDSPWELSNIPIIPDNFQLVPQSKTSKQFKVLKSLISKSNEIINAADAGREGELIFRYILELCSTKAELKRLWISSYTDEAIKKGFDNLKPLSDYDSLYLSGKARSEADWLFGINATIALTKTIENGSVFSLGRVQTPTFALICKRFLENKNFKPVPFFSPLLDLEYGGLSFKANYEGEQILKKELADEIINSIPENILCINAQKTTKNVKQPLCFDLTSLQMKANNAFGFTAEKTLNIIQDLYENDKAVSYPRTDSRYLAEDQIGGTKKLLVEFSNKHEKIRKYLEDDISGSKSFNTKKITDHHAIIPTTSLVDTANWSSDKSKVYNLILSQFFMAFGKAAIAEHILYEFKHQDHLFRTSETVYSFVGWKFFESSSEASSKLPVINENDLVNVCSKNVIDKLTSAKPLFTDATLLAAMMGAGKDFDTEELPDEIKRKGIGTPATRAAVIETLIKRDYITRKNRSIVPTIPGLELYIIIKDFTISNVQLTGDWEEQLFFIEKGKSDYRTFLDQVEIDLKEKILTDIKNVDTKYFVKKEDLDANCPKCNSKIASNHKAYYCSDRDHCDFVLWKEVAHKKLSLKEVSSLIDMKITLVKNLKSREGKPFDHQLFIDKSDNFKLKFYSVNQPTNFVCPTCKQPIIDKGSYLACSSLSCGFALSKIIAQKKLTNQEIADLLKTKKTGALSGFKSKNNKAFTASLEIKDNKVSFKF